MEDKTARMLQRRANESGRKAMEELCGKDLMGKSNDDRRRRIEIIMAAYNSDDEALKDKAKSAMLYQLSGFIGYMIERYYSSYSHLYYQDLYDEGVAAILENMGKYEPSDNYELTTFFTYRIKHAMSKFIAEKVSKTSRYRAAVIREVKGAIDKLEQMGIQNPDALQIATLIDKTVNVVNITLREMHAINMYEYESESNLDFVAKNNQTPDKIFKQNLLEETMADLINSLDPVRKSIIELRYGFTSDKQMSFAQIAEKLGMQKSEVKSIHDKLMRKMRNSKELINRLNLVPSSNNVSGFSVNITDGEKIEEIYSEMVEMETNQILGKDDDKSVDVEILCRSDLKINDETAEKITAKFKKYEKENIENVSMDDLF